jgi:hypothetical protein
VTLSRGRVRAMLCSMKAHTQSEIRRIRKIECSIVRYRIDPETGKQTTISDSSKPYELRRPKGLSIHAAERQFLKRKPRYRNFRGLLVMGRSTAPRLKKAAAPRCPVLAFPSR